MVSITDNSMSRMDAMIEALSPAHKTDQKILGCLHANLELLYVKAKNYHWNVKGVGFQGVHETFDRIQDYAVDSGDRVAERMRYYNMPVDARSSVFLQQALFAEGLPERNQEQMLYDMSMSLQAIHDYIIEHMDVISCPVSQNMTQDICEGLDKFNYFMKSSMTSFPNNAEK